MPFGDYLPNNTEGRRNLINAGIYTGKVMAGADHPHAVARDQATLEQVAQLGFKDWYDFINSGFVDRHKDEFNKQRTQAIQIFTPAFIDAYQQKAAELDELVAGKRRPQPQPETSPTGVTVTVIDQKHDGDIHSYLVRITDPLHFEEALDFPLPLVVDFSEVPASEDTTTSSYGASSASQTRMTASSSAAYETTSKKPQKKTPRFYFGKR